MRSSFRSRTNRTHGRRAYADQIENDIRLARFLSEEVDRRPSFQRLADPVLSIANFRWRPTDRSRSDADLDRINRRIINRLVADGAYFLAPTILKGRTALRVSITNFRTREDDLVALLEEVERLGRSIL